MLFVKIGPVNLHYEIIGASGPVLALNPGGRRSFNEFLSLADKIARHGFRVLLHDRRNCGLSDIYFDRSDAEDGLWAEDLQALLTFVDAGDVFVGGSSSGCRMSILHFIRYPRRVRGLCLFRVTGGPFAAKRLPENYYHRFIAAAREGGMKSVCAIDHWQERFKLRPRIETYCCRWMSIALLMSCRFGAIALSKESIFRFWASRQPSCNPSRFRPS
jgi:pimeloyl-ACP methyl ester carboxylesterase